MPDVRTPRPESGPARVLVVDDAYVVRSTMARFLTEAGRFRVETARDPLDAAPKLEAFRPDVLLLDIEMPNMDGITFLERLRSHSQLPVIMFSSVTPSGSKNAVRALALGASEVICKPQTGLEAFVAAHGADLCRLIRLFRDRRRHGLATGTAARPALAGAALSVDAESAAKAAARVAPLRDRAAAGALPLIALGASTGGLQALERTLSQLTADCAPVLIAQHLPEAFMGAFQERLDRLLVPEVALARDREPLARGRVLIAPGDRQLGVDRSSGRLQARVSRAPPVNRHRPSADHLFASLTALTAQPVVAALLTGMGEDGARGLLRLRQHGAVTLVQTPESCVVPGMPGAALRLGAAAQVLTLDEIGETLAALAPDRLRN